LDILLCGNEKTYCFNEEAFELMETFNIPQSGWKNSLLPKAKHTITRK
jgi:hypothetical protein